jgi:hypothetical protein
MTRHLIALSLAAMMFAAPAIAYAADPAPATSDAPAPKKTHKHHKKAAKKEAAPAADATTK